MKNFNTTYATIIATNINNASEIYTFNSVLLSSRKPGDVVRRGKLTLKVHSVIKDTVALLEGGTKYVKQNDEDTWHLLCGKQRANKIGNYVIVRHFKNFIDHGDMFDEWDDIYDDVYDDVYYDEDDTINDGGIKTATVVGHGGVTKPMDVKFELLSCEDDLPF